MLIGVLISLLCLWLAVRHVPFSDLRSVVAGADWMWLAVAVVMELLYVLSRAQLLTVILDNEVRFIDAFWAENLGYLFTNILPLRMGDAARVLVMSQRSGLSLARVTGAAIIERVFDVFTILLALAAVFPFMNVPGRMESVGGIFAALVLVAIAAMLFAVRFGTHAERLIRYFCGWIPGLPVEKILEMWRELLQGLTMLSNHRLALRVQAYEVLSWGLNIFTYYCIMRAFQPDAGMVEAVFMVVVLCFAVSVPSSPGFIGVFQWAGQQALVLPFAAKYNLPTALAIALISHATYYITTSLLGALGLFQQDISFGSIRRRLTGEEPSGAL